MEEEEEEEDEEKQKKEEKTMTRRTRNRAWGICCGKGFFEDSECHFGAILDPLGVLLRPSWGPLGAHLGGLGDLLGLFGGVWEASWGSLGPHGSKRRGSPIRAPPRRLTNAILEPSWAVLRAVLAALGAVLGLLGPLLGLFWAILGPS